MRDACPRSNNACTPRRRDLWAAWTVQLLLATFVCIVALGTARAATYSASASSATASAYPWQDIATSGTALNLGDNGISATLNIGFTFAFAGTNHTGLRVMSNGQVQFGGTDTSAVPYALPLTGNGGTPNIDAVMMPLWDDLNPSNGNVRYKLVGTAPNRIFVISWIQAPYRCQQTLLNLLVCNGANQRIYDSATFQVQLHESGVFVYRYVNVDGWGGPHAYLASFTNPDGALIGYEASNSDYVQYAFETVALAAGTTIVWRPVTTTLIGKYLFEDSAWTGAVDELKDTAGASGGPYDGRAIGSALPAKASLLPARLGTTGTCGYATLGGPGSGGASFQISGLPVSTAAGDSTSVAFWMYWNGADLSIAAGWRAYGLAFQGGNFGFNTGNGDIYGISALGLSLGWHHVVGVFTNGSVTANKLYIDGSLKALSQRAGTPSLANAVVADTLNIGGWSANSNFRLVGQVDELRIYNGEITPAAVTALFAETHNCVVSPHHLEIRHASGSGVTCAPSTLTVAACADATCSTPYTGGVTGSLSATGGVVVWPGTSASALGSAFTIAPGSSTVDVPMQLLTAGSTLLSTTSLLPLSSNATTCNFGSPSCTFTAADSGLIGSIANHVAGTSATLTLQAVRKSDNANQCVPLLAGLTRDISIGCSYANPSTGTQGPTIGATTLASCNGTKSLLSLLFNTSGIATTTLSYPDAGQVNLSLGYLGSTLTKDLGLTLNGSVSFIAAPASFAFSGLPTTTTQAGVPFSGSLTALNALGRVTPNFGAESSLKPTITLAHVLRQPTGSGAVTGTFSGTVGSAVAGVLPLSNLVWDEVGKMDITASVTNYLGSGLNVSGLTDTVGKIASKPYRLALTATPACSNTFSYSGQPFTLTVQALSAKAGPNNLTLNYNGTAATTPTFARDLTLSDAQSLGGGSFAGTLGAVAFSSGQASFVNAASFTFTDKLTAPRNVLLRVTDTDAVSSSGTTEPSMPIRSGRLRIFNTFGSEKADLVMPVQAEHWSGKAWVLNSADSCSVVPQAAIGKARFIDARGATTGAWTSTPLGFSITAGNGTLTVPKPPSGTVGSIDIALNLGNPVLGLDASCLSSHASTTGAGLPWLRARHGSCASGWSSDPSARVTFGVDGSLELKRTVHVRELY